MKKEILLILGFFLGTFCFAQSYEAEKGELHGANMDTDGNICYVKLMSSFQKVTFKFNAKADGDYGFSLTYKNPLEENKLSSIKILVDNKFAVAQRLRPTDTFTKINSNGSVFLKKGEHLISVMQISGESYLDNLEVVKVTPKNKADFIPSNKLSNENATSQAQALFDYLISMQGKGILSGQQIYGGNTEDIKTIVAETGKYPAVLGVDLIDYSPSRVKRGTNGGMLLTSAIDYWDAGGIITCCWHWNAPDNLVDKDEPDKQWYAGFRTQATTFDFKNGIFNPESKEYKQMVSDIDAIAKPLKVLKRSDIPVLWRPIHEASGGWFWWGAAGKEAYIELYKLIYDRLVNVHKLDNLIWVWNGQDPAWYPGDEYVDVISYDYYPGQHKHDDAAVYLEKIKAATYENKLCALSENGALPNVTKLAEEHSPWSWFCTWNGEFTVEKGAYSEKYTSKDLLKKFYQEPYLITRDELPDFKN